MLDDFEEAACLEIGALDRLEEEEESRVFTRKRERQLAVAGAYAG